MVAEEQHVTVPERVLYAKIPLKEFGEPGATALTQAVDWIEVNLPKQRLMVCCRVGMGRSVSVVIAYLCCVEGMTYPDAVKLVLTRRPGGMPLPRLEEVIDVVNRRRRDRLAPPPPTIV